jgi:type VI secretion system protein ImpH
MASTRRRHGTSLASAAIETPQDFDLMQAIRLIESIAADEARAGGRPLPEPVGQGMDPARAAMRIRSAVPLGYAANEVMSVRRDKTDGVIELIQTIVGLTGPSGVLPQAMSELVQVSVRERNLALRDFLDVFNNRLAGLLYNAWAKYRIDVERHRAAQVGTERTIDHALKSIVGLGMASLADRSGAPDEGSVGFGGLLGRQGRSAMAIERTLSGALGHRLELVQFHGELLPVAAVDRTRLASREEAEGNYARLGQDAVVGARIYEAQSSVLIHVRDLDYAAFRSLLPDGSRSKLFTDSAAFALGADKTFRTRLELRSRDVPPLRIGGDRDDPIGSRLGWNTWLKPARERTLPVHAEFKPLPHLR